MMIKARRPADPNGSSSQFRDRYMVNCYHKLRSEDVNFTWHFFTTSYGKGVVLRAVSSRRLPVVADAVSLAKLGGPHKKSNSDSEESDDPTSSGLSELDEGDEVYNFDSGDEEM
ncbi:hypothetical protein P5673_021738 [Acropora cervicornis]|uniref:Uncharacterized protein n=1 Tax=Acropora cervicornis TaxID=6130 RepID=A0AAD9V002_ACRCE|nr:hypothetical protein P5673_021738 [Acropora cervicornis]